jgi:hypothetical protein
MEHNLEKPAKSVIPKNSLLPFSSSRTCPNHWMKNEGLDLNSEENLEKTKHSMMATRKVS